MHRFRKNSRIMVLWVFLWLVFQNKANAQMALSLETLPPVIYSSIISFLPYQDRYSFGKTSHTLKKVIKQTLTQRNFLPEPPYDHLLFQKEMELGNYLGREDIYNQLMHHITNNFSKGIYLKNYANDLQVQAIWSMIESERKERYNDCPPHYYRYARRASYPPLTKMKFPVYFWNEIFDPKPIHQETNEQFSITSLYNSIPLLKDIHQSANDLKTMLDSLIDITTANNASQENSQKPTSLVLSQETWELVREQVDKLDYYISAYRAKFEFYKKQSDSNERLVTEHPRESSTHRSVRTKINAIDNYINTHQLKSKFRRRRPDFNGANPWCCHRADKRVKDEILGFKAIEAINFRKRFTGEELCQHTLPYLSAAVNPDIYSILKSLIKAGGFDHAYSRKPIFTLLKCLNHPDIFIQGEEFSYSGRECYHLEGFMEYKKRLSEFNHTLIDWLEKNNVPRSLTATINQNLGKHGSNNNFINHKEYLKGANYTNVRHILYQLFPETRKILEDYAVEKQHSMPADFVPTKQFKPSSFTWRIKSFLPALGIATAMASMAYFIFKKPFEYLGNKAAQAICNVVNRYKARPATDPAAQKLKSRLQRILPHVFRVTTGLILGFGSYKLSRKLQNKYYPRFGWRYVEPVTN